MVIENSPRQCPDTTNRTELEGKESSVRDSQFVFHMFGSCLRGGKEVNTERSLPPHHRAKHGRQRTAGTYITDSVLFVASSMIETDTPNSPNVWLWNSNTITFRRTLYDFIVASGVVAVEFFFVLLPSTTQLCTPRDVCDRHSCHRYHKSRSVRRRRERVRGIEVGSCRGSPPPSSSVPHRIVDRWDGVRFSLSGHAVSDRPRIV